MFLSGSFEREGFCPRKARKGRKEKKIFPQINTDEHRFFNSFLSMSICVYLWLISLFLRLFAYFAGRNLLLDFEGFDEFFKRRNRAVKGFERRRSGNGKNDVSGEKKR